jgi:hypothetical protein
VNTAAKRAALGHPLEHDWRKAVADGDERKVEAIGATLRHLDDLHAIFESDRDQQAATATRSYAGLIRERAGGYADHADLLRADARDQPAPAPIQTATTTRRSA